VCSKPRMRCTSRSPSRSRSLRRAAVFQRQRDRQPESRGNFVNPFPRIPDAASTRSPAPSTRSDAARGEDRGRGAVGIAVEADLLRAHALSMIGSVSAERPWFGLRELVVRDHHRHAARARCGSLSSESTTRSPRRACACSNAFARRERRTPRSPPRSARRAPLVVQAGRAADGARGERFVTMLLIKDISREIGFSTSSIVCSATCCGRRAARIGGRGCARNASTYSLNDSK